MHLVSPFCVCWASPLPVLLCRDSAFVAFIRGTAAELQQHIDPSTRAIRQVQTDKHMDLIQMPHHTVPAKVRMLRGVERTLRVEGFCLMLEPPHRNQRASLNDLSTQRLSMTQFQVPGEI